MKNTIHPCPMFVAAQIKFWRKKRTLTQAELSKLSGVKLRHLQEIEAGRVDIKLRTLGSLSQGLGVSPHVILTPVLENRNSMCKKCLNILPRN